jgi:hypothetical protein
MKTLIGPLLTPQQAKDQAIAFAAFVSKDYTKCLNGYKLSCNYDDTIILPKDLFNLFLQNSK